MSTFNEYLSAELGNAFSDYLEENDFYFETYTTKFGDRRWKIGHYGNSEDFDDDVIQEWVDNLKTRLSGTKFHLFLDHKNDDDTLEGEINYWVHAALVK